MNAQYWLTCGRLRRRKTKMFRFTPTPVSSASIFWWCGKGGFADRKCTLDDTLDRWFDERFPLCRSTMEGATSSFLPSRSSSA